MNFLLERSSILLPEASSHEVTMFEFFLKTFLSATRPDFTGTGSLLSVHLGDKAAEVGRGLGRQPVDPGPAVAAC